MLLIPVMYFLCGLIQIVLGVGYFLDYAPIIMVSGLGLLATISLFAIRGILYFKSKNPGEVIDERFHTRWQSILPLGFGITTIGIALLINSVFYNVGTVKDIDVLIYDIVGILFVGWGTPLVLFSLSEFIEKP
tara:strand:+ start:667 stop:1065 length:399 start_codon:yes stop_codon:yes gene_type:complete